MFPKFPVGTVTLIFSPALISSFSSASSTFSSASASNSFTERLAPSGITFTDADTGAKLTIDTDTLQRIDGITAARGVLKLTTLNGVTSPEIQLAGVINYAPNLLTESSAGLLVDGDVVGMAVAGNLGQAELNASIYRYDHELNAIRHNVNGNELQIPQIQILNSKGELVGLIDDMETDTTVYSVATPLDYSPFK